ncbi:MAG: hypothetical protein CBD16_02280 [Betaproteobacteria bacterium TMED156]|nr:MAG: hypothetical protein CBD16_02280 [Betaproteobacteria bacterium TMED156]
MELNLKCRSVVWLRRDLRLKDNSAISKAITFNEPFVICFIFDKEILNPLLRGQFATKDSKSLVKDRRVSFIHNSVKELDESLKKIGSALIVKFGYSHEIIPSIVKSFGAKKLICASDYEPDAIERDNNIKKLIQSNDVEFISVKDQCIFEKTEILSKSKKPYTVFTPYKKAWLEQLTINDLNKNKHKSTLEKNIVKFPNSLQFHIPSLKYMGFSEEASLLRFIRTGSSGAAASLQEFLPKISFYKTERDFPALSATSEMSIHLRFGTISIRELVIAAVKPEHNYKNISENTIAWLSELIWREFYMQILFNFPHVISRSFKIKYDLIEWNSSETLFNCWASGLTGYPIIDAGMRQLNETGFMHNRLRMLTASFLTKDYGINWQLGEKYFAVKLNDFDLSANNGGWQWAASTGCDAQPYFRIFNPITQSKKFDPEGEYIKKFVPELKNLEKKYIHTPWLAPENVLNKAGIKLSIDYPFPTINHDDARKKTLERYKEVRS